MVLYIGNSVRKVRSGCVERSMIMKIRVRRLLRTDFTLMSRNNEARSSRDQRGQGSSRDEGEASSSNSRSTEAQIDRGIMEALKHIDTFYEAPPPGFIKEDQDRPEDTIPDLPQNRDARDFLAKAPSKGLWMPLGKEVKVMQCWKCKCYGHRSGDKECTLFYSGNKDIEKFRFMHEDPMHAFVQERKHEKKEERIKQLQSLLMSSSSSSDSDSNSKSDKKKRKKMKKRSDEKSDSTGGSPKKKRKKEKKKKEKKEEKKDDFGNRKEKKEEKEEKRKRRSEGRQSRSRSKDRRKRK